jgi:hypothetical protein
VGAAAVATVLIYAAVAVTTWHVGRPRLPALAAVQAGVDETIVTVAGAGGGSVAVEVGSLTAAATCDRLLVARGFRFTRTADIYTDPGAENAVIGRIAAAIGQPAPSAGSPSPGPSRANQLTVTTNGVTLSVAPIAEGWLAATAQTGCRAGAAPDQARPDQPPEAIATLLTRLGTGAAGWHREAIRCPGGGQLTVEDAISEPTDTGSLAQRLAVPPTARLIVSPANRVIWREGAVSTVVAASDDGTRITVQRTTVC